MKDSELLKEAGLEGKESFTNTSNKKFYYELDVLSALRKLSDEKEELKEEIFYFYDLVKETKNESKQELEDKQSNIVFLRKECSKASGKYHELKQSLSQEIHKSSTYFKEKLDCMKKLEQAQDDLKLHIQHTEEIIILKDVLEKSLIKAQEEIKELKRNGK